MRKRRQRSCGFTMMEVVLALMIFTIMALMTAAVIPIAARSTRFANDYSQAASLIMHKINQLQEAGYDKMIGPQLHTLQVIDSVGTLPANNINGTGVGTAEFTTRDGLSTYFVGGASDPKGYIDLAPYAPSAVTVSGVTTYSMIQASVRVYWRDNRGRQQSYMMTTLIPKNPIL